MTRLTKWLAAIGAALLIVTACMSDAGGTSFGTVAGGAAAGSACLITARLGGGHVDER